MNALLATASTDGGVVGPEPSGNTGEAKADGGGDGDEHMSETGEIDPPLVIGQEDVRFKLTPLIVLGSPCWNRQRVPYRQKPKELKVRQRAPRGFHSWDCDGDGQVRSSSPPSDSEPPST